MPRAFMVKKVSVSPGKRNWSQLPDHERGEIYVPGLPHGIEQSEASLAESTWHKSHGKNTQIRECDPCLQAAELPLCSALGQRAPEHEDGSGSQEVFLRTKIKVTTGKLPVTEMPSPSPATLAPSPAGMPALVCQVCQKGFQQQRMLKRHLKCHSDIKRHLCSYCGKGFNDTFDLKRHIRTHTGVRPYKCSQCEKGFTQRCSLESHMKKIHGLAQPYAYKERRSKLYVCEECGHTANAREALRRHLETTHSSAALLAKPAAPAVSGREDEEESGLSWLPDLPKWPC
ncbi:putative transcription factor Ovo-like 1 isoform X1 [Brienomyrus brachyistius]|uniref:putative transcription factor Ovo-like 1 isoform X1 n=1 Tax=Brienomyrus brachyistius TaxID=42636 RepID=UPI0020B303AB|nr:putative transcription factor Ovo-like 1 isoform X1 [Brienomyrus brachyistius]XP_048854075.1 putative transcription factor Ovo-like 1 isoform X1 [Brienomyrus brachyistius]XP_048854076.1 putative transcription factor Ovo-like 1 isoform X1 [Brienomyrus brachyistius]XP_048854077.1 putative transcription factor Ovo-like 1 isoform X1 [Brienomyrus brachyistius]